MTVREIKEFIGTKITAAQAADVTGLAEALRLDVIYPVNIESYKPKHPVGEVLVIYAGSDFQKSKTSNSIIQDEDVQITCFVAVRYLQQGLSPEDYCDFIKNNISGQRLTVNRADKMIYPQKIEWLKEDNDYWYYAITFICPSTNNQPMKG